MSTSLGPARLRASLTLTIPLLALSLASPAAETGPLLLTCATNQVGRYEKIEFMVQVPGVHSNPLNPDEVDLKLRFTTPSGKALEVPAFWCQPYERRTTGGRDWMYPSGMPHWKARFAPAELGSYQGRVVLTTAGASMRSGPVEFRCVPSRSRGFVRVSKTDPRFLEFSDGTAFFPIGQNLAFIGDQQYVTLSKAEQIFSKLGENGANYLRIWTCCEDWAMAIEARKSAFGRSWDWKPPFAPMPGAESNGRKCLQLSPENKVLRVNPSHNVALRPATRYVFAANARLEPGVSFWLEWGGKRVELSPAPADAGNWTPFTTQLQTEAGQWWMPSLNLRSEGAGMAWVSEISLREAGGGPELLWEAELNRPKRGYYNPLDCFMLDEVVSAAETNGIYLQLCYLTRDLYMDALKDTASPEYEQAIRDAKKMLRYALARWGYSTSMAAWEYWNEMNPGLPTDRFYAALGEYLEQADPYKHLRTTSTWGPSAKDCRHPKLDMADVHFYLRPSDKGKLEDEVDAVLERTKWIRLQAPNKPVHLGEFGLANEKWQPTEEMKRSREILDFHNALWASALSGASGTAMFWWWDRLDQREPYGQYQPVSQFVADVPWNSGHVQPAEVSCSDNRVRPVGLKADDSAWVWLFNRESAWSKVVMEGRRPGKLEKAVLELKNMAQGDYVVRWIDTDSGRTVLELNTQSKDNVLRAEAPNFQRDIACRIGPH